MSTELIVFAVMVGVFAIVGIAVGMLVAPRLGRFAERVDEDEGDGND
jgi:hypothetical protein